MGDSEFVPFQQANETLFSEPMSLMQAIADLRSCVRGKSVQLIFDSSEQAANDEQLLEAA